MNVVLLQGTLSSEPRRRTLPSGSVLVNWELTTEMGGAKLSVPVTWFDPPAAVQPITGGDEVVVLGTVRRRFYRVSGRTVSQTEVVGERGTRAGRTRQVDRLRSAVVGMVEPER